MPQPATAVVKPAACRLMTSIYPSHRIYRRTSLFFATFSANSVRLFLYTTVSGLLIYLGFSGPMLRPPKAMTLPRKSKMGTITRLRNTSYKLPFSLRFTRPEASISSCV